MLIKDIKKEILYFDPLYDEKFGHYYGFAKDTCRRFKLASNSDIVFLSADNNNYFPKELKKILIKVPHKSLKNISSSFIKYKGIKKFLFVFLTTFYYIKTINIINSHSCKYVIFGSSGNIIFWLLSLFLLKKKYVVIVISLFSHKNKFLFINRIFKSISHNFLNSAEKIFCLEKIYREKLKDLGLKKSYFLAERSLIDKSKKNNLPIINSKNIKIITLGTIHPFKNNFCFMKSLFEITWKNSNLKYEVHGKFSDNNIYLGESNYLSKYKSFIYDDYLSEKKFIKEIINADIIFFPYNETYLENMTSGILYEVFQYRKFILCPDYAIFDYYIKNFKVGKTFDNSISLKKVLEEFVNSKNKIYRDLEKGYDQLFKNFSDQKQLKTLKKNIKFL